MIVITNMIMKLLILSSIALLAIGLKINRIRNVKSSLNNECDTTINFAKEVRSFGAVAIVFGSSVLGFHVQDCIAAPLSASELFAKAENAISLTEKSYKNLLNEWGHVKKVVDESSKHIAVTEGVVLSISKDLLNIESKLSAIVDEINAAKNLIETEAATLRVTTTEKYDLAEASSTSGASPSKTARLFLDAEHMASTLAQEEGLLKKYQETSAGGVTTLSKVKDTIVSTNEILQKIEKLKTTDTEARGYLEKGIEVSVKYCRDSLSECSSKTQDGVSKFKYGESIFRKTADNFNKVITDVTVDQKKTEVFTADIELLASRLQKAYSDIHEWQETSKLRLKIGLPQTKSIVQKLEDVDKSAVSLLRKIVTAKSTIVSKENNQKVATVEAELEKVQHELIASESLGKKAETLLKSAKSVGEIQSSSYLKKTSSSTSYAPTTSTTSTTQKK